jgi:hypothetical protein
LKKIIIFLLLLFSTFYLFSNQDGEKEAAALKTKQSIIIDGFLDESVWEEASPIGDFIQFEQERGKPISFETTARVLYDDAFLYVGFRCFGHQPEKIAARITKRDGEMRYDDIVSVWLDTFHDRRRCYVLATNLLGTQGDVRITDNGKTTDMTWDGIWRSAGQRTEFGWSVEIAIDLNSIKYQPGKNKTWGFNVGRIIPRFFPSSQL